MNNFDEEKERQELWDWMTDNPESVFDFIEAIREEVERRRWKQ